MSRARTIVSLALVVCCFLPNVVAQATDRAPITPAESRTVDPRARIETLRAELARIRREMAKLEQTSRGLVDELRALEREQASTKSASGAKRAPHEIAKPWTEALMQIDDAGRRENALAEIRGALVGSDPDAGQAALLALCQAAEAKFDKQAFRPLVLPWTDHADPALRRQALYALFNTAREPGDLERVLAQVDDPRRGIRDSIVHLLFLFSDGDLTGRAGEAAFGLIAGGTSETTRELLRGLWGARVSPALADKLLELSRGEDREIAHDAIYFGLSTIANKSEAVVDRLIELLADPGENGGRALWGLGQGVPPELQPKVASAMLRLVAARSDARAQERAMRLVGMYGTAEQVPELERIASSELASDAIRKQASEATQKIHAREPR